MSLPSLRTPLGRLAAMDAEFAVCYLQKIAPERLKSEAQILIDTYTPDIGSFVSHEWHIANYLAVARQAIGDMLVASSMSVDKKERIRIRSHDLIRRRLYPSGMLAEERLFKTLVEFPPGDDPIQHDLDMIAYVAVMDVDFAQDLFEQLLNNAENLGTDHRHLKPILLAHNRGLIRLAPAHADALNTPERAKELELFIALGGPGIIELEYHDYHPISESIHHKGDSTNALVLRNNGIPARAEALWTALESGTITEARSIFMQIYHQLPPELRMSICCIAGGRNPDADRGIIPQSALALASRWADDIAKNTAST